MRIKIASTRAKDSMQFRVSKDVLSKVKEWIRVTSEEIFNHQITTGFLMMGSKEKLPVDILKRMKSRAAEDGLRIPYTGASGGAISQRFSKTKEGYVLEVYNSMTKKALTINNEPVQPTDQKKPRLVKLWDISPNEMTQLNAWKQTAEGQGDDSDYIYDFAGTSLGSLIMMMNKRTRAEIDLTDYDSW